MAFFQSKCCTGAASNRAQGLELCALSIRGPKTSGKFCCEGKPPLIGGIFIYQKKKTTAATKWANVQEKSGQPKLWIQHG